MYTLRDVFFLQHNVLALQQQMEELQTACVKLNEVHTCTYNANPGVFRCQNVSVVVPLLDSPKCNHVNLFGFFNLCVYAWCLLYQGVQPVYGVSSKRRARGG